MTGDPVVYLIDDDIAVRTSLESLLQSAGYVVHAFGSAEAFLARDAIDAPNCLILDVRLKGKSGLEFHRDLVRSGDTIPVIFITGHGDVPMSVAAMKAGALEFLTKPFRDQELLDAVCAAIEKNTHQREEEKTFKILQSRYDTLSAREREVMGLLATGMMNKQVAERLGLSQVTVKMHRGQIMQKLEAESVADLVRAADRLNGFVSTK